MDVPKIVKAVARKFHTSTESAAGDVLIELPMMLTYGYARLERLH